MSHSVASTKKESLAPIYTKSPYRMGLPRWLSGKESACNAGDPGDMGSIPGSGRSPGGGNGNPLQFSCLENPMDREAWQATVYGITKSQTLAEQLSTHTLCRTAGPCKSCSYSYSRVTSHGLGLVGWFLDELLATYTSWVCCLSSRMFPT